MTMEKTSNSAEVEAIDAQKLGEAEVGTLRMPESLASLSDEEFRRIGRKATLKMDIVIMPIMVIMVSCRLLPPPYMLTSHTVYSELSRRWSTTV